MRTIKLTGVRQNNLKNIDIEIPLYHLSVICGPSGSGKSSLAFETLFAEGQRRFIESLSNYAKQFIQKAPRPDLDNIENIPPAIALEQRNGIKNARSYLGSVTEIADYLRLLFDKLGQAYCPTHQEPCVELSPTAATQKLLQKAQGHRGYLLIELTSLAQLPARELHAYLLQQGYLRILVKEKRKKNYQLESLANPERIQKGLELKETFVVVDRFEVQEADSNRLADSMELAYDLYRQIYGPLAGAQIKFYNNQDLWLNFSQELSCPQCDFKPAPKSYGLFNSNSPVGACPTCKGFGNILQLDPAKIIPDESKSILQGVLEPFSMPSAESENKELIKFCKAQKIPTDEPWSQLTKEQQQLIWKGDKNFFGITGLFEYLDSVKYKMHVRVFISRYRSGVTCPDCQGQRLKSDALTYQVKNKTWSYFMQTPLRQLGAEFNTYQWTETQQSAAKELLLQIQSRLNYLNQVGLGYLTLSRETRTLSGGEYQRTLLANQLGMQLSQALYVLDEPTIGLHPRDNQKLIQIMHQLRDLGNTLVVVEHDDEVIKSSDFVFEMGPGSGQFGGELLFKGRQADFINSTQSLTASYLRPSVDSQLSQPKRVVATEQFKYKISLQGCQGHNLKNIDCDIPLNRLVVVSGVSGSGKSTLVRRILYPALANYFKKDFERPLPFKSLEGMDYIKDVVLLDQSSLSRNSRSMPVTYLKIFDKIRDLLSATPMAKAMGYTSSFFSLNVEGGRCPHCKGTGFQEIDLVFMDNVILVCEECQGQRYKPEVKAIQWNGYHIIDILNTTVDEASKIFAQEASLFKAFQLLKEVGLSYLKLGQTTQTLSGGEAQRLKIARELLESKQKQTLYLLDEPTTGLHFREVDMLVEVLQKLVDAGGSVVLIEHNTRVIKAADWVIELGPEGGDLGGYLVAQGTAQQLKANKQSVTGPYL